MNVLFEDDDLIAVDKPEGVPSQAADPERPDDVVHRLKTEHGHAYLGVHQRLDKDTSGVLVYAKTKRANPGLARQFEGRTVDKRYVAVVTGYTGQNRTLRHRLARTKDGRTAVARRADRNAKAAVSHLRVIERAGVRSKIEIRIETGRTHQIRAQLEAIGSPILGDALYGGAPAPRLMLHAASLSLTHPVTDEPLCITAELPEPFDAVLHDAFVPFQNARALVRAASERRWGLAHRDDLDAYRLIDNAPDGAPGLALDRYGEWAVAHLYEEAIEPRLGALFSELDARGLYVKRRPKQSNELVDSRREETSPSEPTDGEPAPNPLVITENGLRFVVRLGDGLSTGLFLDQRDNRALVRTLANGSAVLNLFSYTCAFTVAAAAGGAKRTVSVDASKRLLGWGKENLRENDLLGPGEDNRHRFVGSDVFEMLRTNRERFELVVVDPPTYSKTKATRWKSGKDWVSLAELSFGALAPSGQLLACSNDRRMSMDAFRRHLHTAARAAGRRVRQMKDRPIPRDFRAGGLKTILVTV